LDCKRRRKKTTRQRPRFLIAQCSMLSKKTWFSLDSFQSLLGVSQSLLVLRLSTAKSWFRFWQSQRTPLSSNTRRSSEGAM
jgi:hypothetical protein